MYIEKESAGKRKMNLDTSNRKKKQQPKSIPCISRFILVLDITNEKKITITQNAEDKVGEGKEEAVNTVWN